MKKLIALAAAACGLAAVAGNPIISTLYTADPAPVVFGDRVYVYIDRDEGNRNNDSDPNNTYFCMDEWRVYSSADMVNWTDHGAALPLAEFKWAQPKTAWASQCIERNGKYYWYVCCNPKGSAATVIAVGVADSPTGPFKDVLGKPLVQGGWGYIDPTPFIDDDGQAYLYFGNPGVHYVKLNEDMISYSGTVKEITQTEASFGGPKDPQEGVTYTDLYEEGPWLTKRGSDYYLLYAAGGVPEHLSYSMAKKPIGPWHYKGQIMPQSNTNSFTNHCGIVNFKGHDYLFYHTGWLPNGHGFNRAVAVEEFTVNEDGTIPTIWPTREGVDPVGTLSPYELVEGETMAFSDGIQSFTDEDGTIYVSNANLTFTAPAYYTKGSDKYILIREVDFGDEGTAKAFQARVRSYGGDCSLKIHLDDLENPAFAQVLPQASDWEERAGAIYGEVDGVHDVYLTFTGEFDLDSWQIITDAPANADPIPQQWEVERQYLTLTDASLVVNKWWDNKHSNTVDPVTGKIYIHGRPGSDPEGEYYGGQVGWVFGSKPYRCPDWEKFTITARNNGPANTNITLYQKNVDGASQTLNVGDMQTLTFAVKGMQTDSGKKMTKIDEVYFWGYWGGAVNIDFEEAYFSRKIMIDPSGIEGVTIDEQPRQGIYTLDGRSLSPDAPLAPGIYIIDGKKTLVK